MVNSWRAGAERIRPQDVVADPEGIAPEILRGDPSHVYPPLRGVVDESGGAFESVTEAQIQEGARMLLELEGLVVGAPSAAAFAAVRKMAKAGDLPRHSVTLVNLTAGIPDRWPAASPHATVRKADFLARVA
jgi:threonine synthase